MQLNKFIYFFGFVLITQICLAQTLQSSKTWNYPIITPDTAIDDYFGRKVIDPYRNLEDLENERVKTWMKNQNIFYDAIIQNITFRDSIKKELKTLSKMSKKWTGYSCIARNRIFYTSGNMSDNYIKLVYIDSINAEPIELFSTREFNIKDSCYYGFNYYEPSFDGKFIAFGISPNGNEDASIYIIDVENRQLLPEKIERAFVGNIQWMPNNNGFFYIQQRALITEEDRQNPYANSKVMYHCLYTNTNKDKEIFSRELNTEFSLMESDWCMINVSPLSEYVLMNVLRNSYFIVYYTKLDDLLKLPADKVKWNQICKLEDKMCYNGIIGTRYFGLCSKQNPNGQLISMELPDLIPNIVWDAGNLVLEDMVINQKKIYISILEGVSNKLMSIDPLNNYIDTIKLPFKGGLRLKAPFSIPSLFQPSDNLIFSLTGYDNPYGEYICYNNTVVNTNISAEIKYMSMDIITEEIEVPSHDGVLVPLTIVYQKGIKFNSSNPCNIEAYGAYGNVKKPDYSRSRLVWLKNGGIYAYAHVRGGGEKGDRWSINGMRENKPNSWKDLIACAEYLIKLKYTSPEHLAITGKSAGAVTAGRALTERPDLFNAALIYVGVFNPLRMENTFNKSTMFEFGSSKDSLEFQYLYNMDPYHHLRDGQKYPSVLFTAGLNDARVTPWQPAKGVAKMQKISKGDNIVLFYIGKYGHSSYPSDADVYSFLFWQLGHPDFKLKTNKNMLNPAYE